VEAGDFVALKHGDQALQRTQARKSGITQRMLSQQLRELERDGVVLRKVYAQVPPKTEYSLTVFDRTLGPILRLMCKWGTEHARRLRGRGRVTALAA
jgi:DNA-binding HxlR family transcriptional regulator